MNRRLPFLLELPLREQPAQANVDVNGPMTLILGLYSMEFIGRELAEESRHFRSLFAEPVTTNVILLQGIGQNFATLRMMSWFCNREFTVTDDNVEHALSISTVYQFDNVTRTCVLHLNHSLNNLNCVEVYVLAAKYNLSGLLSRASQFTHWYFSSIRKRLSFMSAELLELYLQHDALQVSSEYDVFQAICYWMKSDPRGRMRHFAKLLSTIRFSQLDNNSIISMSVSDLVTDFNDPKNSLINILNAVLDLKDRLRVNNNEPLLRRPLALLRPWTEANTWEDYQYIAHRNMDWLPRHDKRFLLNSVDAVFRMFVVRLDHLLEVSRRPGCLDVQRVISQLYKDYIGAKSCILGTNLYVAIDLPRCSFWIRNLLSERWFSVGLPNLGAGVCLAMCTHGVRIYLVIRSEPSPQAHNYVQTYNTRTGSFERLDFMLQPFKSVACCAYDDRIWIFGDTGVDVYHLKSKNLVFYLYSPIVRGERFFHTALGYERNIYLLSSKSKDMFRVNIDHINRFNLDTFDVTLEDFPERACLVGDTIYILGQNGLHSETYNLTDLHCETYNISARFQGKYRIPPINDVMRNSYRRTPFCSGLSRFPDSTYLIDLLN